MREIRSHKRSAGWGMLSRENDSSPGQKTFEVDSGGKREPGLKGVIAIPENERMSW